MTGFSADWLTQRAAADSRARARGLAGRLAAHFAGREGVRVLDLGAGTGANMRATSPLLGPRQHWVLADNDPALLARAGALPGLTVETRVADLAADLEVLFDPVPDLVTASAFFDLCGAAWLDRLVARAGRCGAAFYAVLTYDGREEWEPSHPFDAAVLAAFHADQRRDKGLGPSLGPGAHAHLAAALAGQGLAIAEAPSDWVLERPRDADLIAALAAGSAAAVASALGTVRAAEWQSARTCARRVVIGHRDLLALPRSRGVAGEALRTG